MTGAQALTGYVELYDVAGRLRGQLIALIDQVRLWQGDAPPKTREPIKAP